MIVVDVETTGTNPNKHSLASIGAIDFNNSKNQFYEECRIWDGAHIDKEALQINGYSETALTDPEKQTEGELVKHFLSWVENVSEHTIAGHNPFFDVAFIQAASGRNHLDFSLAHRIIDLHSIVYFHMIRRGLIPPVSNRRSALSSDFVMEYVGIPAEPKPHIAINGAKWEIEAFSRIFYEKPTFEEFKKYEIPWKLQ